MDNQSRRTLLENTWFIHSVNANTCHLGVFCTNWQTADSGKVQSTAVALQNSTAGQCSSSVAASQNVIAPRSHYHWTPSPSPVLAEPNHCGLFLMTGEYFEGALGPLGRWEGGLSTVQVADNVAAVALGRKPVYSVD